MASRRISAAFFSSRRSLFAPFRRYNFPSFSFSFPLLLPSLFLFLFSFLPPLLPSTAASFVPLLPCISTAAAMLNVNRKVKKEPLEAWILREFTRSETDDDLIMRARRFIFLLLGGHMLLDMSGSLIHVRCMVSIRGMLGCTPSQQDIQKTFAVQPPRHRPREPIPECGARGVNMAE
ncbi:hypothetical protein M9H77_17694 [Catharanthus roseus]|uniref:Uncharacterized protein n=1 Tax=Catharanthus roseus TaxID=4058 RepID=A0ACC0B5C6_CATRO|nr:hypothetical protein M9H77_17694 [Catharanthus roseus]